MIITDQVILRTYSKEFKGSEKQLNELIQKLEKELHNSKIPGVGLSAIQIGLPLQIAIIRHKQTSINLYNAKIIKQMSPFIFKNEGCLSIPNTFKDTVRFNYIEVKNGNGSILKLTNYIAVIVQHELCHFKGELFTDYAIN